MLTTGWVMGVEGGFESGNCISTVGVFGGEIRAEFVEISRRPGRGLRSKSVCPDSAGKK
jgi:hypothetical protein